MARYSERGKGAV